MSVIAFSGKGGTGKTTLASLALEYFMEKGELPLALDLDPDAHLFKALGMKISRTMGEVVDKVHKEKKFELEPRKPPEMADIDYFFNLVMTDVMVEGDKLDLLTLGKPTGDIDCYCPAFYWADYAVERVVQKYGEIYTSIVIDCDPGTEIFPRKILDTIANTCGIDRIFTVLDGSRMSLDTAKDIVREVGKRDWKVGIYGIFNKVEGPEMKSILEEAAAEYGIDIAGFVPLDGQVVKKTMKGQSLMDLSNSPAYDGVCEILGRMV